MEPFNCAISLNLEIQKILQNSELLKHITIQSEIVKIKN